MAIIDTLKLARALEQGGGFSRPAAEALNTALGEDVATKMVRDGAGLRGLAPPRYSGEYTRSAARLLVCRLAPRHQVGH
jgi:hypothetical protein